MNHQDIEDLLQEGEGVQLEFKRKVAGEEKVARTLVAFANTRGGTILFGIDDDKSVVGVESEKIEVEMIERAGSFLCYPPIETMIDIVPYRGKDVIAVTVEESRTKPHAVVTDQSNGNSGESRVFIRVHDKTVAASKEVVHILRSENPDAPPLRIAIGDNERRLLDFLDRNERITVKQFGQLVNISDRRASRALIQLVRAGVLRIHMHEKEDYYTLAFK